MTEAALIPLYGCCPEDLQYAHAGDPMADKYGALWPKYLCECPTCSTLYVWCGAHYEGGQHYTCDGCSGYPFCMCTSRHTGPCQREGT